MSKVVRKTGFLGLGKPVVEFYCDKCNTPLESQFFHEGSIYCEPCANNISLSIVHRWDSQSDVSNYHMDEFFTDSSDGKEKYITQCYRCEGLIIHVKNMLDTVQQYYQVGNKEPRQKTFKCIHHGGFNEKGNVRSQGQCHHSWVIVATSKLLNVESQNKYESMMHSRNDMLEQMFGTDEIDIQYHCFGATHFWCSKCGLYRRLNPQREHLLPTIGVKNA
jgi:hypothetical protein